MSEEDSIERRRREREERRRKREEEMRREEEELERAREQRKKEREERRRKREEEEAAELAAIESRRADRAAASSGNAGDDKEAQRKKEESERQEKEEAEKKEQEEREARRKEREEKEEAERKEKEEAERKEQEDREKEREARRKEREEAEQKEQDEREKEREARRREREEAERKEEENREKEREARRKESEEAEQKEQEERETRRKEREEAERKEQEERDARKKEESREKDEDSCESCGKSMRSGASFCKKCGHRQGSGESTTAAAAAESSAKVGALEKEVKDLKKELEKLKDVAEENEKLKREIEQLKKSSSSVSSTDDALKEENEMLKKEIEKLKASQSVSVEVSSAPRLTTATRSRPTKSGRRAQTVRPSRTEEAEEEEEPVKEAAKPRSTGNRAADLLAATMRGALGGGGSAPSVLKKASGNVFVSAGTKGGEISRCLFLLKGKVRIRAVRVQDSPKSITQNDVFILETKTHIWTYIGKKSNRLKIARAVDVVGKMQRQRGQARSATLVTVDTKQANDMSEERNAEQFWKEFPEGEPASIPEGVDDTTWEQDFEAKTSLFRVDPGFELELVAQGRLGQELLESDKIFLLDTPNEMFVWTGRSSDVALRKEAVEGAQEMLEKTIGDGLKPAWVEVERVAERGEGALFEDKFFKWSDSMRKVIGKVQHKALSNVALSATEKKQELPRIKEMHDGELVLPKEYTSEISGTPEIVMVKDFRRQPVPLAEHGIFYTKQCYIVLYKYDDTGVFYYWLGRDAGVTEMGSAASLAKEWAGECGLNRPNLVRVDQGHEPAHFLRLFKGRLLAFIGEHGSEGSRSKSLFQIRGTDESNTRTFECPDVHGIYLNSDDAFVLNTADAQFAWLGKHASPLVHDVATFVADRVRGSRSTCKTMDEGSESSAFKDAIEWSPDYAKHETRPNDLPFKLFICTNSNKQYRADRVADYVQRDLSHGVQAILDRHSEVIVWLGNATKKEDKKIALELAVDYVEKADDGRKDCEVWVLDEGEEVVDFSRYFQAWDPARVKSGKKHVTRGPPKARKDSTMVKASELLGGGSGNKKYPLKKLLDRDYLPVGVDKKCLEEYLQDSDFPEAFGITAKEFWALPAWKRLQKKKGSPLF